MESSTYTSYMYTTYTYTYIYMYTYTTYTYMYTTYTPSTPPVGTLKFQAENYKAMK